MLACPDGLYSTRIQFAPCGDAENAQPPSWCESTLYEQRRAHLVSRVAHRRLHNTVLYHTTEEVRPKFTFSITSVFNSWYMWISQKKNNALACSSAVSRCNPVTAVADRTNQKCAQLQHNFCVAWIHTCKKKKCIYIYKRLSPCFTIQNKWHTHADTFPVFWPIRL